MLRPIAALRLVILLSAGLGLSGCGLWSAGPKFSLTERLALAARGGSSFNERLAVEYSRLAQQEEYQNFDFRDSERFARKGLDATEGKLVLPATFEDYKVTSAYRPEMERERIRLLTALEQGGRLQHPAHAARAQAMFDCWLEEQEENRDLPGIAECRAEYLAAVTGLEASLAALVMPVVVQAQPMIQPAAAKEFRIYFPIDQHALTQAGDLVADDIASSFTQGFRRVRIIGHTDRAGGAGYNRDLGLLRSDAVKAALVSRGVPPQAVVLETEGETRPAAPTADGVQKPLNRRVQIILE